MRLRKEVIKQHHKKQMMHMGKALAQGQGLCSELGPPESLRSKTWHFTQSHNPKLQRESEKGKTTLRNKSKQQEYKDKHIPL